MILANDEWLTVKFTPDLETGQSFSNCRCKLARTTKKADVEETTFDPSLHPRADYNTKRLRHGPLRSALT